MMQKSSGNAISVDAATEYLATVAAGQMKVEPGVGSERSIIALENVKTVVGRTYLRLLLVPYRAAKS